MAEPSITAGTAVATGLTIFGISTGLDPAILIAGLAGGLWAQSYHPPTSIWRRVALIVLAAILAGYLAPAFAAVAASSDRVAAGVSLLPIGFVITSWMFLTRRAIIARRNN